MSPQWTDAQQAAITDTGGALLVSAAAGSGKTAVLVERAVTMLTRPQAPVSAERLLLLTFTNAAAEELRSRIATRLEASLRAEPGSQWLRRQRLQLKRAFIGTIDAYCQQLVREHFTAANIPPDVVVADAALLEQLSARALDETMELAYEDESFRRFAALYGRARSDAEAAEAVLGLYAFTRTLPAPQDRLRAMAAMYTAAAPLLESAWGKELAAGATQALREAAQLAGAALALAEGSATCAAYAPALAHLSAALDAMRAALARGDWDETAALVSGYRFQPFKAARNADETEKARITEARDTVKKILAELEKYTFACTQAEYAADLAEAAPMVEALCRAAALYAERFTAAKLAERVLDFADFEHLALELLRGPDGARTPLAATVSARYDAVMVDEYQDTNELQAALYEHLALADGSNLFYVGDVKQSIYRFRAAEPGLFLAKRAAWRPLAEGQHPAVLTLGHNFRSTKGVVDGVNYLFGQLMSPALGEVDYSGEERLICAADYTDPGATEVVMVEGGGADEAAWVAARIARMVAKGALVEKNGERRPAGYGDFCILLRSRARMPEFTAALAALGVPAVADRADTLLDTPEVLPLTAALAAISNPGDDVALAAAMLGPLFRFTAGELAAIRCAAPRGRLWGALTATAAKAAPVTAEAGENAPDAEAALRRKAARFTDELLFYRGMAAYLSVGRLCEELVNRTGYLAAVAAMESGAARRDNLQRFIGWAAEVSATGRGGLDGFVRLMAGGQGPQAPPAKLIPGHVSLLTVHKSKGLEFPFCFLCDADRGFNRMDLSNRVQMHAGLGIGLALRHGDTIFPTLPMLAIRAACARQSASEEMRVLYVALTRARQRMTITFAAADPERTLTKTATAGGGGTLSPFLLGMQRSPAAWVMSAVTRQPGARADTLRFQVAAPPPAGTEAPAAFTLSAAPDEALAARLAAGFTARPARFALRDVPAKLSVSAIAKPGGTAPLRRPSFMYREGLTAAERGTAQHAFMQFANYDAARRDVEAELRRLVSEALLDAETAAAVDRPGVRRFLSSPLAQRIAAAQSLLREYDFIVSLPAGQLRAGLPAALAEEPVLLQGIVDLIVVNQDGAEVVDYKTDRGAGPDDLRERYATQLNLYRQAVQRRLSLPVTRLTIWSFELGAEVALPL